MKNIIEIFYDYLWNPQKKHLLLHIMEILDKNKSFVKKQDIFKLILEEKVNDSNTN
jgi:hypothetical protein